MKSLHKNLMLSFIALGAFTLQGAKADMLDLYMMGVLPSIVGAPLSSTLKKTGQTIVYTNYDDGWYKIGVTPSYTRNADETVTDHITGLMWQDDAAAKTWKGNWSAADVRCRGLTLGTYADWRVPTLEELQGIVVNGAWNPSMDTGAFINYSTSTHYWSSTVYAGYTDYAWSVSFANGYMHYYDKATSYYVRCVRAGY